MEGREVAVSARNLMICVVVACLAVVNDRAAGRTFSSGGSEGEIRRGDCRQREIAARSSDAEKLDSLARYVREDERMNREAATGEVYAADSVVFAVSILLAVGGAAALVVSRVYRRRFRRVPYIVGQVDVIAVFQGRRESNP